MFQGRAKNCKGAFLMKILISGGGTGGHINPGLAIAEYFRKMKPDCEILFVGTTHGLEGELIPKAGFEIKFIEVSGFKRKLSADTFRTVKKMFKGYSQSVKIIKEFNPDVVIGTGGYVCGPVLYAASRMKKKTFVHEQNVIPGVTVKILARVADVVFTSFEETAKYLDRKNLVLSGNPIFGNIMNYNRDEARGNLGFDSRPLLLAYGGSLGAARINDAVCDFIASSASGGEFQMIFATGKREFERVSEKLGNLSELPNIRVLPYIYNMGECMAAADVVISRAGAMTVSELSAVGKPSILIPSPNVAHNHQEFNARSLESRGAAVVIRENELSGKSLASAVTSLVNRPEKIEIMAENSKKSGIVNAAEIIFDTVMKTL